MRCTTAGLALAFSLAARVAASAAGPSPSPGAAVRGSIGLRLVDVPVAAGNDPRARVYIVDRLAPGAMIRRRIEVSNTTASTVHVVLYPAAATIANGSFVGSAGRTANDLSMWSSVEPGSSDVPAEGRAIATVTVTVPRDAAPGERYGVVWAEAPDGQPVVVATVHNNGGRALDMSGTLRLSAGPAGLSAGPFPATLGVTLAIGDTEPVTVTLDQRLPAGPWDAQITLRSGLLERSARANLTFPSTGTAAPMRATPTSRDWPRTAIAVVAGVLLCISGAAVALARRQHDRPAGRP